MSGPRARTIVAALTDADLSRAALPFGAAAEIDIGYARAWIVRRSFFGELGFEIYPSTDLARHVYESLVAAGAPHDLRHSGFFAMNHCRLEKGFVHYGHDLTEDDTPLEAGLDFAVAFEKPGGFVGRDALVRLRDRGCLENRLVNVRVREATLDAGPYLLRSEPIWNAGEIVGSVSSGGWGFRVGASLAIGTLRRAGGVTAEYLREDGFEVEVAGIRHPIDLQFRPHYDPDGERMRA